MMTFLMRNIASLSEAASRTSACTSTLLRGRGPLDRMAVVLSSPRDTPGCSHELTTLSSGIIGRGIRVQSLSPTSSIHRLITLTGYKKTNSSFLSSFQCNWRVNRTGRQYELTPIVMIIHQYKLGTYSNVSFYEEKN